MIQHIYIFILKYIPINQELLYICKQPQLKNILIHISRRFVTFSIGQEIVIWLVSKSKPKCQTFWFGTKSHLAHFKLHPRLMRTIMTIWQCRMHCSILAACSKMSSMKMLIRIPQTLLMKAMTGFKILVSTLGEQVNPKGITHHSSNWPSQLNLRYFLEPLWTRMCR